MLNDGLCNYVFRQMQHATLLMTVFSGQPVFIDSCLHNITLYYTISRTG